MKIGRYIVGLISGLTFGMLFAPKKGEELRAEIVKKTSKSGTDGLKVIGNAFKDAGEDVWKELKNLGEHEQVVEFLQMSQDKMKNFLEAAQEKGYDVAAAVQEKFEELAGMAKKKVDEIKNCDVEESEDQIEEVKNASFSTRKVNMKKATPAKKASAKKTAKKKSSK